MLTSPTRLSEESVLTLNKYPHYISAMTFAAIFF